MKCSNLSCCQIWQKQIHKPNILEIPSLMHGCSNIRLLHKYAVKVRKTVHALFFFFVIKILPIIEN